LNRQGAKIAEAGQERKKRRGEKTERREARGRKTKYSRIFMKLI